jgi:hypothetical protein
MLPNNVRLQLNKSRTFFIYSKYARLKLKLEKKGSTNKGFTFQQKETGSGKRILLYVLKSLLLMDFLSKLQK